MWIQNCWRAPFSERVFFLQRIHTVKGFGIVNKAKVDVFLELSCFFDDPTDVGNLISGFSAFSKSSLNIWKFTVHVPLKPALENFEQYFASMWDECNCAVVWAFFAIAFLWDWNENWPFPVLWPLLSFQNLLAYGNHEMILNKIVFKIKPTPTRDAQRTQNRPCTHQDPEIPQRLNQCAWVSPAEVQVSSGLLQGQGLWIQQTWVWHKPSWRLPFTHNRGTRTYTGLGNRLLEGTNKTLCAPGPWRKEQWLHRRLTQNCPWVLRSLQQRRGSAVACYRVGESACMGQPEGGRHFLHYLKDSLASGQTTGREHSPTHQQKIGWKVYWAWPCPSEQDPVSPSVSLSQKEASISLLSFSIRGQTEWKPQSQKINRFDHMAHSLV